ncbi:hypothetical protein Tco_0065126 [Tanacetum coccineum]
MTTLPEHIIVAGVENRPPMLEKSMYDSWASRIRLFIKGEKHGRMMLDSIDNDDCDVQATNIILHGLPSDVYALVNIKRQLKIFGIEVKHLTQQSQTDFPQLDFGLAVPTFQQGDDPIDCINKAMAFLSAVASRFLLGKGTSQDSALSQKGQEVLHGLRRTFQTKDLDAYDSDCDDISTAKAVLMENLSSCDSNVLSEVPYSDTYLTDMINQDVQEILIKKYRYSNTNSSAPNDLLVLSLVEQMTDHVANLDKENQTNKMVNESLTAELERYKERVAIFEQRQNVDLNKRRKLIDSQMDDVIRNRNSKLAPFQQEIDTLKETLSNHVKENESL